MSVSESETAGAQARTAFERLLAALRPKLHRYCARMTGSVIDGEDVVQEALMKAITALPQAGSIADPEGWLFRIAHNAAVDFLRQRARQNAGRSDEDPDMVVDTTSTAEDRQLATASLRTFMRLPVAQRSSVILMDVLGYSLDEIGRVTDLSIPAVKAALHRGRERLREIATEPEDLAVPALPAAERTLLAAYVDRFNARDFDAIRDMLADEVRLELVNRTRMNGRSEVGRYFHNYNTAEDWQFALALVDRRPALVVRDPGDPAATPAYFVLLQWRADRLTNIRDFRYARYAMEGAEIVIPD
jgi:RNA polymerase sigma-70 factor (ECF subfamily)